MAKISVCPDVSELGKFATGHLPPPELESLVEHLAGCEECLAKLPTISSKDTLVGVLTKAQTLAGETEDPAVTRLVARLAHLGEARQTEAGPPMLTFSCSACGKSLKVKAELAGKKVRCPKCSKAVPVPEGVAQASARKSGVDLSGDKTVPPQTPGPNRAAAAAHLGDERTVPPVGQAFEPDVPQSQAPDLRATADATQAIVSDGDTEGLEFLAPPQQSDELGRLGTYRILKKLGAGGMGMVFLAEDTVLHRKVAIKVMLPQFAASSQARERFLREAVRQGGGASSSCPSGAWARPS
jgi:DNA-directed RNA polymerase subunit RPC12/RpoP